jgi:ribosomal protein S18 acetylase RimI-like enzyme
MEGLDVRPPAPGEGAAIARAHVRSWQVAYRGIFPDDYLDRLDDQLAQRTERWEGFIARDVPLGRLLVATLDGRIVAFSSFGPAGGFRDHGAGALPSQLGEIYGFYTDPSYWRRGAGRALMERTIESLAAAGFEHATLWVLRDNPRARAFYEATGWRATGDESIFRRDGHEAVEICYERTL